MEKRQKMALPDLMRRAALSWLAAAAAVSVQLWAKQMTLKDITQLQTISFLQVVIVAAAVFSALCLVSWKSTKDTKKMERFGIFAVFTVLAAGGLAVSFTVPFLCAVILAEGILLFYAKRGEDQTCLKTAQKGRKRTAAAAAAAAALIFFAFVSVWTVCRVLTYSSPTFDFGIFSQMFHHMKTTGIPNTTVERDGLLSHFNVHVSPIYYAILPFYCLYPEPVTLQVMQAAILALAVIPAWKLARKFGCGPWVSALFCVSLLLYPAYSGGTSYDLHENVFLTPLILWLFYSIDTKKGWGVAVFGILTLMVKEDAAVYVAVIALWLMLRCVCQREENRSWGLKAGGLLFAGALVWFFAVTGYLAQYGDGVMTGRYSNFFYDGSDSLFSVIKVAILCPLKVLYECADSEKLLFLAQTMIPLCGLPFLTRKYERMILLIPYVLVNLMSDYTYQHDIFFQYTYGSTPCLFYLVLANYADLAAKMKSALVRVLPFACTAALSAVYLCSFVVPKALAYPTRYAQAKEYYQQIDQILQTVPQEASATATTFYTVPLSEREILYDVRYSSLEHILSTEYVVLAVHDTASYTAYAQNGENGYENFTRILEENGYEITAQLGDTLTIYRREPQTF